MNENFNVDYLKYNRATLPQSIFNYFLKFGRWDGEEMLPPFNRKFWFTDNQNISYECFMLEMSWEFHENDVKNGRLHDENGNTLNEDSINEYRISYAKGFYKGYSEFLDCLNQKSVFKLSNNDIAYKIFERIYPDFLFAKFGNINLQHVNMDSDNIWYFITKQGYFSEGYEGGEYYKAWEIILSNPMQFVSFFDEKVKALKDIQQNIDTNNEEITYIIYFQGTDLMQTHEFTTYERQLKRDGFNVILDKNNVPFYVYTAELMYILASDNLPVIEYDTNKEIKINCFEFGNKYIEGFKEGCTYFDENFSVPTTVIYGENAVNYFNDLKVNYSKWGEFNKQVPNFLKNSTIKKCGYYAGLVSKVKELKAKFPKQFDILVNHVDTEENLDKNKYELLNNDTKHNNLFEDSIKVEVSKPKLCKEFTVNQIQYLFDSLIDKKIIETDFNTFNYVFGYANKPIGFNGLKWLIKNKQSLRIFLTPLKHHEITIGELERAVPLYFIDKMKEKYTLANNDTRYNKIDSDNIEEIIKNIPTD